MADKNSLLAVIRQHVWKAALGAGIILAGHWYRYRHLDQMDALFAAIVFISYLALASWLAWHEQ